MRGGQMVLRGDGGVGIGRVALEHEGLGVKRRRIEGREADVVVVEDGVEAQGVAGAGGGRKRKGRG